jgi:hypothetical protein
MNFYMFGQITNKDTKRKQRGEDRFPQLVSEKLDIHLQKNEVTSLPYKVYRINLQYRSKCET